MKDKDNGHDPRVLEVAGKRVWLKERLPLKDGAKIVGLAQAINDQDLESAVPLFKLLIERWEFDGDPAEDASYEDLDIFSVFLPLVAGVGPYVQSKLDAGPKASARPSGSP